MSDLFRYANKFTDYYDKPNMNAEYSEWVDELRKNRVAVSYYKYGSAKINFGEHLVNAYASALMCMEKYQETKNTEYLLDAMNYLMFEFMYPPEGAFFRPTDSNQSAGKAGVSWNEILEEADR